MTTTKAALLQRPDVAMTVKLKGRATVAGVTEAVGYDASPVLDELVRDGVLEPVKAFYKITPLGLDEVEAALGGVRDLIGEAGLRERYEAFCTVNDRFKATVTDWQLRSGGTTPVINDHSDAAYDASVLGRLATVHGEVSALLSQFPAGAPRFRRYGERLESALDRLVAGDRAFMASPAVDSYHSVWFELHEELILLCGLTRAGEAEAGRG